MTRAELIREARAASKAKTVRAWIAEVSESDIDKLLTTDSCPDWLTKLCELEIQRRDALVEKNIAKELH